jgi:hypothetical protein
MTPLSQTGFAVLIVVLALIASVAELLLAID